MDEKSVNLGKFATGAAWAVVVLLMVTAWIVMLLSDHWRVAGMLAASSCASSAFAATMQIRCYAVRTSRLIVAVLGPEASPRAATVRSMR